MKKALLFTALLAAGSANASVITDGTLYRMFDNRGFQGSTVDHWGFSTAGGVVTIDTLSMERAQNGIATDVNGDGEIAYFDPFIYLFRDDGSLGVDDLIGSNDDSSSTFGDGSVHSFDSFLSQNLLAGNYILAIGAFNLSVGEAISQVNAPNSYPSTCEGPIGTSCTQISNDHGDYQITWSDNVVITSNPGSSQDSGSVPEPTSLALLGLGLAAFRFSRKK